MSPPSPPAGWRCSCANQSLCQPLAKSATPAREVVAYYEDRYDIEHFKELFTGSAVSTIAVCEAHAAYTNSSSARMKDEHLCYAHERGVRVVPGCIGCDVWSADTSTCIGHTNSTPYDFDNATARRAFVGRWAGFVHDHGYDGVQLDFEGGIAIEQRGGLTALVREMRAALAPSAQLSFASACYPRLPIAARGKYRHTTYMDFAYDYAALAASIDYFFLMCYADVFTTLSGEARPMNPLPELSHALATYPGAHASQLVVGLPWYTYDTPCASPDPQQARCTPAHDPTTVASSSAVAAAAYSGGGRAPLVNRAMSYFALRALLAGRPLAPRTAATVTWRGGNATAAARFINYRNGSAATYARRGTLGDGGGTGGGGAAAAAAGAAGAAGAGAGAGAAGVAATGVPADARGGAAVGGARGGEIHRVYVEDENTLGARYAVARKLGARGVGCWLASGRWPDEAPSEEMGVQAMWSSVVEHFLA